MGKRASAAEPVAQAIEARDELTDALERAGIKLPSLGVDVASCCSSCSSLALIELGRCNIPTALALAAALRSATTGAER